MSYSLPLNKDDSTMWCFVESIRNTLSRIRNAETPTQLDRERLVALRGFLSDLSNPTKIAYNLLEKGIAGEIGNEMHFCLDSDIQATIESIPSFEKWQPKKNFTDKINSLIDQLDNYNTKNDLNAIPLAVQDTLSDMMERMGEEAQTLMLE